MAPRKSELERENDRLRRKLEEIYNDLGDALGLDDEDCRCPECLADEQHESASE